MHEVYSTLSEMQHSEGEDNSSTSFENIELLTTPRPLA